MKKLKWIYIWCGLQLLKRGLRYRINNEQQQWLQPFPPSKLVNRKDFILNYCRNKSVLHIGFADAPFTKERIQKKSLLHLQLRSAASFLYGIDTDAQAVMQYQKETGDSNATAVALQDLQDAKALDCEVVLAGEVLEHMTDPMLFIRSCASVLKPGKELMVTVPNYTSLDSIAASLNATESIHEDHHWYFSPYTLLHKFDQANWELKQFVFGVYGDRLPNSIQQQFPATGDCIIAVFKRK